MITPDAETAEKLSQAFLLYHVKFEQFHTGGNGWSNQVFSVYTKFDGEMLESKVDWEGIWIYDVFVVPCFTSIQLPRNKINPIDMSVEMDHVPNVIKYVPRDKVLPDFTLACPLSEMQKWS